MLGNYLKIALRNTRRNPVYAAINMTGLAVSMAVCLLLITFIWEQFQYDEFHEHKDRIMRVITDEADHSRPEVAAPAPLAPVLERFRTWKRPFGWTGWRLTCPQPTGDRGGRYVRGW